MLARVKSDFTVSLEPFRTRLSDADVDARSEIKARDSLNQLRSVSTAPLARGTRKWGVTNIF